MFGIKDYIKSADNKKIEPYTSDECVFTQDGNTQMDFNQKTNKDLENQKNVNAFVNGEIEKITENINELSEKIVDEADGINYTNSDFSSITSVKEALDAILYIPLEIEFNTFKSVYEKGQEITGLTVNWSYNKNIISQALTGAVIHAEQRDYTYTNLISDDKIITLSATDERKTVTKKIEIKFYNCIYYGASEQENINNSLITGLTKRISNVQNNTITVNCGQNENIYFCAPSRLNITTFINNGFEGGMNKITSIQYTNIYGYSEEYDVWKSSNCNLGITTLITN